MAVRFHRTANIAGPGIRARNGSMTTRNASLPEPIGSPMRLLCGPSGKLSYPIEDIPDWVTDSQGLAWHLEQRNLTPCVQAKGALLCF